MDSFPIDRLANSGVPVDIGGKTWYVAQLTLRDQGKLQAVIRKIQPTPLSVATSAAKGLGPDIAGQLLKDARKDMLFWPSPITSQEGLAILFNNEEGQKELIKAAFGKRQPITDEDIDALLDSMTYVQFMRIAAIAISGEDPETDPKA